MEVVIAYDWLAAGVPQLVGGWYIYTPGLGDAPENGEKVAREGLFIYFLLLTNLTGQAEVPNELDITGGEGRGEHTLNKQRFDLFNAKPR